MFFTPIPEPTINDLFWLSETLEAHVSVPVRGKKMVTVQLAQLAPVVIHGIKPAYQYLAESLSRGADYWPRVDRAAREAIARRDRRSHPPGTWDKAGRFYAEESCECCRGIRSPSRSYPFSEMVHARTALHVASVFDVDLAHMRKRMRELDAQ